MANTITLSNDDVAKLRAIVEAEKGVAGAARALRVPRGTLQAALAGVGLREGTVMVIRDRLAGVIVGGAA